MRFVIPYKPGTIVRIDKEIKTVYPGADKPDEVIPANSVGVIMWHHYDDGEVVYFAKFFKVVDGKVQLGWGSDLPPKFKVLMEA